MRDIAFISYSHCDSRWLQRLRVHLKPLERQYSIGIFDDTKIQPGQKWKEEIMQGINSAKVAVLLISADFLASDFINDDELPSLISAAESEGALILPIMISPCVFHLIPSLSQLEFVNPPSKPLITMSPAGREAIFAQVVDTIYKALTKTTMNNAEYINQGTSQQRCNFTFLVDEDINLVEKVGSVRVFSTRGKKCGLEIEHNGIQGYCYWHESDPSKAQDPALRKRLEAAVQQKVYLGGAFLSGGGPGTYYADSAGPLDLSGANLQGAFLAGAYLEGTILKGANLREANLMSAWFGSADLSGADLTGAHLQNTDFGYSSMAGAELWGAEINSGTRLEGIYWGDDYILATERRGRFDCAEVVYRTLGQHSRDSGDYSTAGEFYFREMECVRKQQRGRISLSSSGLRRNVVLDYIRAANASLPHEMPGVFLCHSSSDKPFTRRLALALIGNGLKVWIDEAEIRVGESLIGKIESGISGSKYLIAVLSNNSINSRWCAEELRMAMFRQIAQKGITVLPVLTEECEIPGFLQEKKYADFRNADDFDKAVAELCAAIQ